MNIIKLQKGLSNVSDMLSKIPVLTTIRHDVQKVLDVDSTINVIIAEVDQLLDETGLGPAVPVGRGE